MNGGDLQGQFNPSTTGLQQISTVENLKNEGERLAKRVSDIDEALKILADNPQIERLLTIIGGRIY